MENKEINKQTEKDLESQELLRKSNERKGKQLRVDLFSGDLTEINELKNLLGKSFDDPDEKYNVYYRGIRRLLMKYLPKGKDFADGRQLIYDEKNIFLNRGKRISDNNGLRKSDGRMNSLDNMHQILDVITTWVSESQNSSDLYNMLYDLNEKNGYGHEIYDETSIKYQRVIKREKGK